MHLRISALVALMVASGCHFFHARAPKSRKVASDLPISRVILYQNGVGYFERRGTLDGNILRLQSRPSQINDLLKSLTVIDRGSGRPVSVSLPLEKQGAKVLADLPKQVRNASGLRDVLKVFRGARVSVYGRRGSVRGRVVGVERGVIATHEKGAVRGDRVTIKTRAGSLVSYPIYQISRLVLADRALELGLEKSLDVSLQDGSWKPIRLSVRLAGNGKHDVLVSYIVEMPNWKPAYRLVLDGPRKPLLQGWAIVDNVSGESWNNVALSLVAGTPMSFIYDLHSPQFTRRVDLSPRRRRVALAPTIEKSGYRGKDRLQRSYSKRRGGGRGYARRPRAKPKKSAPPTSRSEFERRPSDGPSTSAKYDGLLDMLKKEEKPGVKTQQVGSLFRYDLRDPVTVPDRSSTLVNIVNARVDGAEVVMFRPELTSRYRSSHPYRAVRLTNSSGVTLEGGPVTIYSAGTFVGEGFVDRLEQKATTFLTFAIDGKVSMTHKTRSVREPQAILKISGGSIYGSVLHINRYSYELQNKHDRPITAFIKSIGRSGYKLRKAPEGTVKAGAVRYIPVTIPAGGEAKLSIEWVSPRKRWFAFDSSLGKTLLKLYSGSGKIPASVRPVFAQVQAAQRRIAEINSELYRLRKIKRELSRDQDRVRANLKVLRKVKGNARLKAQLTKTLSQLEKKLNERTAKIVKLDEERARLHAKIRTLISSIKLDFK